MGQFKNRSNLSVAVAILCFAGVVRQAEAVTFYMTTNSAARIGGLTDVRQSDVVAYTTGDPSVVAFDGTNWTDSASIYFRGRDHFRNSSGVITGTVDENLFAFNIFDDGRILLTVNGTARLGSGDPTKYMRDGGSKFDSRDLVLYDPATDTATLYLDGALAFRMSNGLPGASATIDSASLLPNGHLLISTRGGERIGSNLLEIRPGDVIEYDPVSDIATLYFDQNLFRKSDGTFGAAEDIDGVSYYGDNLLLLTTNTAARLGLSVFNFSDQDVVIYDLLTDTATLFFDGDNFRRSNGLPGADEDLKGIHLFLALAPPPSTDVSVAMPEPASAALLLIAGALSLKRRRQQA
ncbi:MAG: PEP-CTERM sorting domain-containing protein [Phycisphaeraceae bacterium]